MNDQGLFFDGFATKKQAEGNHLLSHNGQGSSFTARVEADPQSKSAILIVTNAKVDLDRLRKATKIIRKYYAQKQIHQINSFCHSEIRH
jgi:hypothetical protein